MVTSQVQIALNWAPGRKTGRLHLISAEAGTGACGVELSAFISNKQSEVPRCVKCSNRAARLSVAVDRALLRALTPPKRSEKVRSFVLPF